MSEPFAPPGTHPQPDLSPSPGPAYGPGWRPVQHSTHGTPGQAWAPQQPFTAAPKQGNGLAITAIVIGGLALLGVLGLAAFMAVGIATTPSWVLEGEVAVVDKAVQGPELEKALTSTIEADGSLVGEMVCPARSQVGQGLVSVCHGSVDDWDWTGVVVFEDDTGTFIVNQL